MSYTVLKSIFSVCNFDGFIVTVSDNKSKLALCCTDSKLKVWGGEETPWPYVSFLFLWMFSAHDTRGSWGCAHASYAVTQCTTSQGEISCIAPLRPSKSLWQWPVESSHLGPYTARKQQKFHSECLCRTLLLHRISKTATLCGQRLGDSGKEGLERLPRPQPRLQIVDARLSFTRCAFTAVSLSNLFSVYWFSKQLFLLSTWWSWLVIAQLKKDAACFWSFIRTYFLWITYSGFSIELYFDHQISES